MAQRRMFSPDIVDSDAFLDMGTGAQLLYFHLAMRADDDGFIGNPKKIARVIGSNEDDMKLLLVKRFLLTFNSGVVVIKHWRIHNYIRADIYKETLYKDEKGQLGLNENNAYTEKRDGTDEIKNVDKPPYLLKRSTTLRKRNERVPKAYTQVRIGKDRIVEQLPQQSSGSDTTVDTEIGKTVNEVLEGFKGVNPSYTRLYAQKPQRAALERLLKAHGVEKIKNVVGFLPRSNGVKYAPTITTPIQLEIKLGELLAWSQKQKDTSSRGKNIII